MEVDLADVKSPSSTERGETGFLGEPMTAESQKDETGWNKGGKGEERP
jgi:hypothetical protein